MKSLFTFFIISMITSTSLGQSAQADPSVSAPKPATQQSVNSQPPD